EAVLADPCRAGPAYTRALDAAFGHYLPGASALQRALMRRPRAASASMRLVTAPGVRQLVASTWSIYWNGLAAGAALRPAARVARPGPSADWKRQRRCWRGGALRLPGGKPPDPTARNPPMASSPRDAVTRARALAVEDGVAGQGGGLSPPLTQPARELCGLE